MNEKMPFEEALNSVDDMIKKFSFLRKEEMLDGLNQEDLYAELRIVVWRSWLKWKPDGGASFSTFAYTALERGRKSVLRHYRTKSRGGGSQCIHLDSCPANGRGDETTSLLQYIPGTETDVYEQIYWKGAMPIIDRCVDNINEQREKLIIKLYLEGLSQDEISQEAHCAQSLVSYYLRAFRTKLRAELVRNGYTKYGSKYDA